MPTAEEIIKNADDYARSRISWVTCKKNTTSGQKPIQNLGITIRPRYTAREIPDPMIMQNPKPNQGPYGGLRLEFERGRFELPRAAIDPNATEAEKAAAIKELSTKGILAAKNIHSPITLEQAKEIFDTLENPETFGYRTHYQHDPLCPYWLEMGQSEQERGVVSDSEGAMNVDNEAADVYAAEEIAEEGKVTPDIENAFKKRKRGRRAKRTQTVNG